MAWAEGTQGGNPGMGPGVPRPLRDGLDRWSAAGGTLLHDLGDVQAAPGQFRPVHVQNGERDHLESQFHAGSSRPEVTTGLARLPRPAR